VADRASCKAASMTTCSFVVVGFFISSGGTSPRLAALSISSVILAQDFRRLRRESLPFSPMKSRRIARRGVGYGVSPDPDRRSAVPAAAEQPRLSTMSPTPRGTRKPWNHPALLVAYICGNRRNTISKREGRCMWRAFGYRKAKTYPHQKRADCTNWQKLGW